MTDEGDDDLPTVEEYTDPNLATYTPPPTVAPGICPFCRTATEARGDGVPWEHCWSCGETRSVKGVKISVPPSKAVWCAKIRPSDRPVCRQIE
jgi:hypothetical protein